MRTVFSTATTANGYLATPEDSLDWLFAVQGEAPDMAEFTASVAVVAMGSTTYEWILRHEDLLERPEKWREFFGPRPVVVFTHRELPVPAGADVRFVAGPVAEALPMLEALAGDGVLWLQGGGDLAGQFDDAGALDEIELAVAPAFLAAGRDLLPRSIGPERLDLRDVRRTGQFAVLRYRVD